MAFMEDGTSIGNILEMSPNARNEGPTIVVVDESSKSLLCNNGEDNKWNIIWLQMRRQSK